MREHGAGGAFSAIFIDVVELATIEPGVRLVCAHSPNSPIGAALTPPALASAVGLRRLGRTALEGPQIARFSLASACRASAFCIASRVARFSLLASQPRQRSLSLASLRSPHAALRNRAPHSAAATFIACFFVPSTLRVSGAASLALGGPFRSGSRLGRDSRLGTPWMLL